MVVLVTKQPSSKNDQKKLSFKMSLGKSSSKFFSESCIIDPNSVKIPSEDLKEKCRKYYKLSYQKYNEYFLKCVEEIEELQPNGYACVQAMRYFIVGVLPKHCVIPDPLSPKERDRVERMLAE